MPKFADTVDPFTTAILIIDMTNDFVAPDAPDFIAAGNQMAPRLGKFLDACRQKRFRQIIFVSHCFRPDGRDMHFASRVAMGIQPAGPMELPSDVHMEGTRGVEIYAPCGPKEGEITVKKHHYSAFDHTNLDVILRANQIKTVVITGACTDCCCSATAHDAFYLDYDVIMLADFCLLYTSRCV